MSLLPKQRQYFVYPDCVDGRKSFNGLCGLVSSELGSAPASGDVFIFVNRSRQRLKLLFWEPGGFVLYYKKMDEGTFRMPMGRADGQAYSISEAKLLQLLRGVVFQKERFAKVRQRPRVSLEQ